MRVTHEWSPADLVCRGPEINVSVVVVGHPYTIERATAFIDTGCDVTRIERTVFDRLPPGITPCRYVKQNVEKDGVVVGKLWPVYAFMLTFLDSELPADVIEAMPWDGVETLTQGGYFLLGREFLRRYVLTYDGTRTMLSLATERP